MEQGKLTVEGILEIQNHFSGLSDAQLCEWLEILLNNSRTLGSEDKTVVHETINYLKQKGTK